MEGKITESTRYLCAAVQIDERLCDQIIQEFLEEDYTVIGICHGVDIPTVLKSCLLAKKRRNERDNRLSILLGIGLFISFLFGKFILWFLILYPIAWRIVFLDRRKTRYDIVGKYILKKNYNPDLINLQLSPDLEHKFKEISETQNANVIIYGGFSPFVGAGLNINGWSFTVDINKGKEEMGVTKKPLPFQVTELYEYISDSIKSIGLGNLTIEDNLYINGQEIRDIEYFLPAPLMRPNTRFSDSFIKSFIEKPTYSIRHYRCLRVTDWNGELILSIFIRFSKIGQSLFLEANYYLLTPLREYYRQYDAIKSELSSEDIRKLVWESAFTTFGLGIGSLIFIFTKFSESWQKKKRKKQKEKEIISNPTFNYGPINSLRERVSQDQYYRYFQRLDQEMYLKIIQRKIVDGLSKFLDSKNIDITDFKEAKSTILNHGVMVSGGSIQAQNLTVGKEAKSMFSNIAATGSNAGAGDSGK